MIDQDNTKYTFLVMDGRDFPLACFPDIAAAARWMGRRATLLAIENVTNMSDRRMIIQAVECPEAV